MASFIRRAALYLGVMSIGLTVACAKSTESTTPSPASDRTEPPRLLTRGSAPDIAVPESNAGGRPTVRVRIQVMVDSLGRADARTLKLTGVVGTQDRLAIERWLQSVTFRPAMRNGQPVSGQFDMTLEARVVRR